MAIRHVFTQMMCPVMGRLNGLLMARASDLRNCLGMSRALFFYRMVFSQEALVSGLRVPPFSEGGVTLP
jgi:hypothetical protein